MTETTLSASPTKHLTSWWKTFKTREDSSAEGMLGKLSRPAFPHMSRSSSAIPRTTTKHSETNPPVVVSNQGKQVQVPSDCLESPIFGTALSTSIRYASVKISLTDRDGDSFVYGHVPVIVAKCALYLKQDAREVDGIFRISGSSRRIRVLQDLFNSPPRFGKDIEWQGFSVHDAANVLRRFLNNLPEPIIPLKHYEAFRDPLRRNNKLIKYMDSTAPVVQENEQREPVELTDEDYLEIESLVATYQQLMFGLPPVNLQLLVYLLDLLAVFAAHSDKNRMPAFNLSAIFQPSILSHPDHDMSPEEYHLSRLVVELLITKSGSLLQKVQILALEEHEKIKAVRQQEKGQEKQESANSGNIDGRTSANGNANGNTSNEMPPAIGTLSRQSSELDSEEAKTEDMIIPVLRIEADTEVEPVSSHQRRHSKSMSSAVPPVLLIRDRKKPFHHDNDSGTSLRRLDSNEDTRKPRWRRSLMILKNLDLDDHHLTTPASTSPMRSTSPSRSWFRRKLSDYQ